MLCVPAELATQTKGPRVNTIAKPSDKSSTYAGELKSSDLLHTHLVLAGKRFNYFIVIIMQGEMLSNSQAKVVELHRSLMHHARLTGISDQELLISNSNLAQELESSQQYGARCDQCALCTLSVQCVQKASHIDSKTLLS